MEYQIVEIREHSFMGDDGKIVNGQYIYLKGEGGSKRVFIGKDRDKDFASKPKKGDTVLCFWGGRDNTVLVDMLKV